MGDDIYPATLARRDQDEARLTSACEAAESDAFNLIGAFIHWLADQIDDEHVCQESARSFIPLIMRSQDAFERASPADLLRMSPWDQDKQDRIAAFDELWSRFLKSPRMAAYLKKQTGVHQ